MKKGILLLLLISSVFAHSQSLKDALFGGKLKNDPGTVIRKGDDLSAKIDTAHKLAAVDTVKAKLPSMTGDTATATKLAVATDVTSGADRKDTPAASVGTSPETTEPAIAAAAVAPKNN